MQGEGPSGFLRSLAGRAVVVKMSNSAVITGNGEIGVLENLDNSLNVVLRDAVETLHGQEPQQHSHVLLRGNTVLYIAKAASEGAVNA